MSLCIIHSSKATCKRPKLELADIFKRYLADYLKKHRISLWQKKVLYDIQVCRTAMCGGHIEVCDHCDYEQPAYNSCHNRHCPKCQGIARRRWVAARLQELLPVPYYHVVFTLPHRLNNIALYNKRLVYDMFYKSAAYTLLKFGRDPKWLGAQLGLIGVLHTWGKGLCYHIHWHFIIPGGGLTDDGQWQELPYDDKFLFPPKAMSKVVRARFIKLLRKAYNNGKINMPDSEEPLQSPAMFEYFLNDVASDKWVNYCKRPFGGRERVLKYIGRYTHRVAISNHRLINIKDGKIRFFVKNYKKGGATEPIALTADEFIRRFLMHILPRRFRKIRYAGFLAPAIRDEKLRLAKQSLQDSHCKARSEAINIHGVDLLLDPIEKCPRCHIGRMRSINIDQHTMRTNWMAYINSS
jgi:hypothetical protein